MLSSFPVKVSIEKEPIEAVVEFYTDGLARMAQNCSMMLF